MVPIRISDTEMPDWYYQLMGESIGPLSNAELVDAATSKRIEFDTLVRQGDVGNWVMASTVKGLFEKAESKRRIQEEADIARGKEIAEQLQRKKEQEERARQRYERIRISTSGPPPGVRLEIIDIVFAVDCHGDAGLFFSNHGDPNIAFDRTKWRLRESAYRMGADAVINCQFEYRVAISANKTGEAIGAVLNQLINTNAGFGTNYAQTIEIFAYGTAVKFIDEKNTSIAS